MAWYNYGLGTLAGLGAIGTAAIPGAEPLAPILAGASLQQFHAGATDHGNNNNSYTPGGTAGYLSGSMQPTSGVNLMSGSSGLQGGGSSSSPASGHANRTGSTYTGGGSTYSPAAYYGGGTVYNAGYAPSGPSAAEIAAQKAYDTYKGQANKALDQLLGQYNTAKQTTNSNYNTQSNQLQSGYNAAKNNYNDATTQARQDQLRQDNQIRVGTHNAYENLMNLLGAFGGGASSVATQWAPEAAQKFQNAQLGGVDQNTAANLRSLNTNWGNYQNDFNDRKKQLADQKAQALADAQSQYNTTRGQLHDILSAINNQSVDPSSIGSELSSVRASIPNNKFVAPTFTGNTPVYHAPNLANFEIANPTANMTTQAPGNSSVHTPAIVALLNQQKRQNVVA